MSVSLTKEELMQWRRTTEKITLEEFASRLGKSLIEKKETKDLHDILLKKVDEPETIQEVKQQIIDKKIERQEQPKEQVVAQKQEKEEKPAFGIKITFAKKLNKREEVVFNYFCKNRNQKVMVKDIARVLGLPNDYVYKYIKNLRSKLTNTSLLENADQGGYILHA